MIEFRQIEPSATPPLNDDWALIERARGRVAAKGSLTRDRGIASGPTVFADLHSAIDAMKAWAEKNNVPVIYLKDQHALGTSLAAHEKAAATLAEIAAAVAGSGCGGTGEPEGGNGADQNMSV